MKINVTTAALLGLMLSINSVSQAQTNTSSAPAEETTTTTTTTEGGQKVERVEVIGSRIKRIQKEGANPVKSVGKENMQNSANTTASDALRDSTVASFGARRESSGSPAAGVSTIGLRGLSSTQTLVLLNGHRLPKDPYAEAVDLNWIPQGAIERIEILKDGASALYGSDALGGVVNIVTKKNYSGTEASFKFSGVEKPGGNSYDVSLLSGTSREKLDFVLALNYTHTDKIMGKDRELTKDGLSPTGTTGAWRDAGGTWTVQPGCPPDLIMPDPSGNGNRCYFRYNEVASVRPQIGQINLLTDLTYRLDSGVKLYNRNIVVHKDMEHNFAPTPGTFNTPTGTGTEPNARRVAYRFGDMGNRDSKDTELNYSALVGAKGSLTSIWEYDFSVGYSEVSRRNEGVGGYMRQDIIDTLVTNGDYDPLAPAGSREVTPGSLATAAVKTYQNQKSKLLTFDGLFTGELGEMEHGPIGIATGISAFNEKLDQASDPISAAGLVIGGAGSEDNGSRDVQSAFAEVSFPLTESFELDVAARVDHYSDFGTTANPKVSGKWTISPEVLVRSSVGTGFKAPTLSQLYGSSSTGYATFIDRGLCATTPAACNANQYLVEGGGNRDLKEEKAFSASLGTVVQPTQTFSFSLDAWYTKLDNVVGIDYEAVTEAIAVGPGATTSNGVTVTRGPGGDIESINAPYLNLASEELGGIDFNFELLLANNVLGHQLSLNNDFSYMAFDNFTGFPGTPSRNVIGEWGKPQWRNVATLSLRNDVSTVSLAMRSIPGQNYVDREIDKKISDLTEYDLNGTYKFTPNIQVGLGIKNVLDAKQPVDPFGGTGGLPELRDELYDVNGRKFFLSYNHKF